MYQGRVGLLASKGMVAALLDAVGLVFVGWSAPLERVPQPLMGPTVAVDSGKEEGFYRVVFLPHYGGFARPF